MAENKDGTAIDSFLDRGFLFAGGNMDISEMKKEALQAIAAETMENARNFLQGYPYGDAQVL